MLADCSRLGFDVHWRSSSSFFLLSLVSHRLEKQEDLPSIYSTYCHRSFSSFFPHSIAGTYTQTFSSRLPLLVGQAFLFAVSPASSARSLARVATASTNIVDTSPFSFFCFPVFFLLKKLKQTSSRVYVYVCIYYFATSSKCMHKW